MDLHTLEYENATIVVLCTYHRGPVYSSRVFGSWQLGTAQLLRFFWGTSRSGTAKEGKKKYGRYVNNRLDNCVNGLHKFGGKKNGKERKITEKKYIFLPLEPSANFISFIHSKRVFGQYFFSEGKCHLWGFTALGTWNISIQFCFRIQLIVGEFENFIATFQ